MSLKDFEILGNLGQGAFGEVLLVLKLDNKKKYAVKIIDKFFLEKVKL